MEASLFELSAKYDPITSSIYQVYIHQFQRLPLVSIENDSYAYYKIVFENHNRNSFEYRCMYRRKQYLHHLDMENKEEAT